MCGNAVTVNVVKEVLDIFEKINKKRMKKLEDDS